MMAKMKVALFWPVVMGKHGLLPFTDGFARGDGPIGGDWTGACWTISSGKAICTPATIGAEILADPGLEANYTAGKCDTLTASGSPTLAQSADVHGGTKAQEFTATAQFNTLGISQWPGAALYASRLTGWCKRTAGAGGNAQFAEGGGVIRPQVGVLVNEAAYTLKTMAGFRYNLGGNYTLRVGDYSAGPSFDTIITDDWSIKHLSIPELIASLPQTQANVDATVAITHGDELLFSVHAGLIIRLDSTTNPQNYILGLLVRGYGPKVALTKVVNGAVTNLINNNVTYSAGANLRIVASGSSVSIYYNGAQVGATQTIDDAGILNNKIHGLVSCDASAQLDSVSIVAA